MHRTLLFFLILSACLQGRLVEQSVKRSREQRTVHIRGTVRDTEGRPMAGVTVTAKGN